MIKKYNNFLNESVNIESENKQEAKNIVEIFQDLADDGFQINFLSPKGWVSYSQYVSGYPHNFTPVYMVNKNKKKYVCTVTISTKSYNDIIKIVDESSAFIGRLDDIGWKFVNFKVDSYEWTLKSTAQGIRRVEYKFIKPDVDTGDFIMPSYDDVRVVLRKHNIYPQSYDSTDTSIEIECYTEDIPDKDAIFIAICDELGFDSYDYYNNLLTLEIKQ